MSQQNKTRLLIVIATYNEFENLPSLVDRLFGLFDDLSILIVDDNSPDGTGKWAEERSKADDRLTHIGRAGKLGLGSATIEGFRYGLENGYGTIGTMDADWSHDPEGMLSMWKTLCDLSDEQSESLAAVIGSRYVTGGNIEGWPLGRLISSRGVNWFTRLVLRVPTRDNTSAMRIYRSEALRRISVLEMKTSGYAYLEELIFRLAQAGFDFVEHPITFVNREKGNSKASIKEGLKVFSNILRLRFSK